jgi:hypothetical protein
MVIASCDNGRAELLESRRRQLIFADARQRCGIVSGEQQYARQLRVFAPKTLFFRHRGLRCRLEHEGADGSRHACDTGKHCLEPFAQLDFPAGGRRVAYRQQCLPESRARERYHAAESPHHSAEALHHPRGPWRRIVEAREVRRVAQNPDFGDLVHHKVSRAAGDGHPAAGAPEAGNRESFGEVLVRMPIVVIGNGIGRNVVVKDHRSTDARN